MTDKISVTSTTSYGTRVGNSFTKIFGGILLVIGAIWLLAWNENNFVEQKAALDEGNKIVQTIESTTINPELDGQLVYLSETTSSPATTLQDSVFGVKTEDLKLIRNVERYQWKEIQDEQCYDEYGGGETCTTTYEYKKVWSEEHIDSDNFYESAGHYNPSEWEYRSQQREKSPILLGAFTLGKAFTDQLNNKQELSLADQEIVFPEGEVASSESVSNQTDALSGAGQIPADPVSANKRFHLVGNEIYVGKDPQNPKIGDMKISFSTVKTGMVTVVGKQAGEELDAYTTSNQRKITLLEEGKVTVETMFANAHATNNVMTWFLRMLGLFLMYLGFRMMFEFVETLAKVLPPLATLIGLGTSLIAFASTLVIGFGTIAVARIAVRPMIGVPLLIGAVGAGVYLIRKKKQKKAE